MLAIGDSLETFSSGDNPLLAVKREAALGRDPGEAGGEKGEGPRIPFLEPARPVERSSLVRAAKRRRPCSPNASHAPPPLDAASEFCVSNGVLWNEA